MKRTRLALVSAFERVFDGVHMLRPTPGTRAGWLSPARTGTEARAAFDIGAVDDSLRCFSAREPSTPSDVALYARALIGVGRDDEAREWIANHRHLLSRTAEGVGLLSAFAADGAAGPFWASHARPNFVGLEARLARGDDRAEIVCRLATRPWAWFANPELHLFAYNAFRLEDPERALRFLNRYASACGMPRMSLSSGGVGGVAFPSVPRVRGRESVTVVVSVYNAAATVADALLSVLRQSYSPIEILVCDDASTDDSLSVVRRLLKGVPRARLFQSTKNQGPYNVRNQLLHRATGSVITFHDADDIALPNRFELQLAELRRSGADACVTRWLRARASGEVVFFPDQSASRLSLVSLMIDTSVARSIAPFRNAAFGADLEYFGALRQSRRVWYVKQPTIWSLWVEGSLTRASGSAALENGYRSPARRAYSSLLLEKRRDQRDIGMELGRIGLLRAPHAIREIALD